MEADVDVHGDGRGHDGHRVGAAENLPRGYVAQREERCRVILIDIEGDAAVENGRVCAAIVMIDVGAGVPARLRGNDTAENVGVALDPWTGAVLGGSNLRRIRHHEKGEAKCSLTHASPGLCAHHVPPRRRWTRLLAETTMQPLRMAIRAKSKDRKCGSTGADLQQYPSPDVRRPILAT